MSMARGGPEMLPSIDGDGILSNKEYKELSTLKAKLDTEPAFQKRFADSMKKLSTQNPTKFNNFVNALKIETGGYFNRHGLTKTSDFYDIYKTICDTLGISTQSTPEAEIAQLKSMQFDKVNPKSSEPGKEFMTDQYAAAYNKNLGRKGSQKGQIGDGVQAGTGANPQTATQPNAMPTSGKNGEKQESSIENGPNKKYVDAVMNLPGLKINRVEVEKIVGMIRTYYDALPGLSQRFSFGDVLGLVTVESEFNKTTVSYAGCHGLFQIGNESVNDMITARPQAYNKTLFNKLKKLEKSYVNNSSSWHDNNDNAILGLTNLDGVSRSHTNDPQYSPYRLDKYHLEDGSFSPDSIKLNKGKSVSKKQLMNAVQRTAAGKGLDFDQSLFDRIYTKVMNNEGGYRNKFNTLYQYNAGINYPFTVLYTSEKMFGESGSALASAEKTMPKQNSVPEMPTSKSESQPKGGRAEVSETREKGGNKEYLLGSNTVVFGDSWAKGLGECQIESQNREKGKKPAQLANVNGFHGKSSDYISSQFKDYVAKQGKQNLQGKDLVIIAGVNNAGNSNPTKAIDDMIDLARANGMKVTVCNYCTDYPDAKTINAKLQKYEKDSRVHFVDLYHKVPGATTNLHPESKYSNIIATLESENKKVG